MTSPLGVLIGAHRGGSFFELGEADGRPPSFPRFRPGRTEIGTEENLRESKLSAHAHPSIPSKLPDSAAAKHHCILPRLRHVCKTQRYKPPKPLPCIDIFQIHCGKCSHHIAINVLNTKQMRAKKRLRQGKQREEEREETRRGTKGKQNNTSL